MINFTKIAGVIGAITILISMILSCLAFLEIKGDEKFLVLLFIIPLYFLSHFLIRYKFGFINDLPIEVRFEKFLFTSSVIFVLIIFASTIILAVMFFNKRHNETKMIEKYSVVKKWKNDTTAYGLIGNLSTKFDNNEIKYQLSIQTDTINRHKLNNITKYKIRYLDKDGFILDEILLTDFTKNLDSLDNLIGQSKNSSHYVNIENYDKYSKWELVVLDDN